MVIEVCTGSFIGNNILGFARSGVYDQPVSKSAEEWQRMRLLTSYIR
jgi:hypothetical protein